MATTNQIYNWQCKYCKKLFPYYYVNKGSSYLGDRGRYNFRAAKANFLKHEKACYKRKVLKIK